MADSFAQPEGLRQRVIPENRPEMLKAVLRKPESRDYLGEVGRCLESARLEMGWTLDQLAGELPPPPGATKRDPRQVQKWIDGKERCQVDVVMAVECLRAPFVIALARLTDDIEEETTLRRRRSAR